MPDKAALFEPRGEGPAQLQHGLAAGQVEDLAIAPGHGAADAQADGFGEGLFRAETRGEETQAAGLHARAAHGWIYALTDGRLKDLQMSITGTDEIEHTYESTLVCSTSGEQAIPIQ